MYCTYCKFEQSCRLRDIAPNTKGCIGPSERKDDVSLRTEECITNQFIRECEERKKHQNTCSDFVVGDMVKIYGTTLGTRLPRYLERSSLRVIGFTKHDHVLCDYDGGKPFSIPPSMLKKI